ncbi:hypothetical protein [Actinoplanes sp. NPDC026623]|uniref:hypothetical protein n=1 Tax=Actinoplanes sp. NPDC026623 TaxID=3155610 RepID=UPI00340D40F0
MTIWDRVWQRKPVESASAPLPARSVDEGHIGYLRGLLFTLKEFEVFEELTDLLIAASRFDEAAIAACFVADGGYVDALARLDQPLDTPETLALAIAQLEQRGAVSGEYEEAANALAELLYRHGLLDQLLTRADPGDGTAGDHFAAMRAADVLIERQRTGEAIDVLLAQSANSGAQHAEVGQRAVALLLDTGRFEQALAVLCDRADSGDWDADEQCARLLVEHGRLRQLRARADSGSWHARQLLSSLLADRSDFVELRERADAGDVLAARRLAEALAANGQEDELRRRAATGDRAAAQYLADLLIADDETAQAACILQASSDAGDLLAAELLDQLNMEGNLQPNVSQN